MTFTPPTLMGFSGPGFSFSNYSLRGLTATLEPIAQTAQIHRTINGTAADFGDPIMRKYRVTITCKDQESPGFAETSSGDEGVWPGSPCTVTLIPQLGSSSQMVLSMIVVQPWREVADEWNADNSWELVLEEV